MEENQFFLDDLGSLIYTLAFFSPIIAPFWLALLISPDKSANLLAIQYYHFNSPNPRLVISRITCMEYNHSLGLIRGDLVLVRCQEGTPRLRYLLVILSISNQVIA